MSLYLLDNGKIGTGHEKVQELVHTKERLLRELEQERQDHQQADLDCLRALGERNDARQELAELKAVLTDPLAVHLNMMRGTIRWTPANLYHLLGQEPPTSPETA